MSARARASRGTATGAPSNEVREINFFALLAPSRRCDGFLRDKRKLAGMCLVHNENCDDKRILDAHTIPTSTTAGAMGAAVENSSYIHVVLVWFGEGTAKGT